MAYRHFKDLPRRTAYSKVLFDKSFNIAKNLKYVGYQGRLASMVFIFFEKKYFTWCYQKWNYTKPGISR